MSKLVIIPARGGSKRIPRKNIKYFFGKPILAYSIEVALESNLFDEVMVSTDDKEIKEIAESFGAKVPFLRSEINSDDFATTADVIDEVLLNYKKIGNSFDYCVCIYPTAPLLSINILEEAISKLIDFDLYSVFPVLEYGYPIQRALRLNEDNRIEMIDPSKESTRSQDLKTSYHDAGQFYALNAKKFKIKKKLWTENTGVVKISNLEAQDIDNIIDWRLAELKYKLINDIP